MYNTSTSDSTMPGFSTIEFLKKKNFHIQFFRNKQSLILVSQYLSLGQIEFHDFFLFM